MSQDLKPMSVKRCFTCTQWDGIRSFDHVQQLVKVDAGMEANCRIKHKNVKGSFFCPDFFKLS